jgi:hypothetical protein
MAIDDYLKWKKDEKRKRNQLYRERRKQELKEQRGTSSLSRSEYMKIRWSDPDYRKKHLALLQRAKAKNSSVTIITREKISQTVRELWKNGTYEGIDYKNRKNHTRPIRNNIKENENNTTIRMPIKRSPKSDEWRKRMSEIIAAKWREDDGYRDRVKAGLKTLNSKREAIKMATFNETGEKPPKRTRQPPSQQKSVTKTHKSDRNRNSGSKAIHESGTNKVSNKIFFIIHIVYTDYLDIRSRRYF